MSTRSEKSWVSQSLSKKRRERFICLIFSLFVVSKWFLISYSNFREVWPMDVKLIGEFPFEFIIDTRVDRHKLNIIFLFDTSDICLKISSVDFNQESWSFVENFCRIFWNKMWKCVILCLILCDQAFTRETKQNEINETDAKTLNERPIIGILAQEISYHLNTKWPGVYKSYIAASYVKWIESAGARPVPIWWAKDQIELSWKFETFFFLCVAGLAKTETIIRRWCKKSMGTTNALAIDDFICYLLDFSLQNVVSWWRDLVQSDQWICRCRRTRLRNCQRNERKWNLFSTVWHLSWIRTVGLSFNKSHKLPGQLPIATTITTTWIY